MFGITNTSPGRDTMTDEKKDTFTIKLTGENAALARRFWELHPDHDDNDKQNLIYDAIVFAARRSNMYCLVKYGTASIVKIVTPTVLTCKFCNRRDVCPEQAIP
jgi:hypothetical protein